MTRLHRGFGKKIELSDCAADRAERRLSGRLLFALAAALILAAAVPAAGRSDITDINPSNSDLDTGCPAGGQAFCPDPDGASGGRLNGLATVPGTNQTFYGASEWGGVYRTTNGGLNWTHLVNHVPMAVWDVEVDPNNAQRVYATSFYDGRINPASGINVSTDGGTGWTRPPQAFPANSGTYTCSVNDRNEPSTFGIAIRPDATGNVAIGTNCGLALSTDSGVSWAFVDPKRLTTPAGAGNANIVWDVVYQTGGILDVCGNDGHFRSTDGGATWARGTGLPAGLCSIVASPDESYVLFVAASDNNYYETDNADAAAPAWANRGTPDGRRQGRVPFVATNQRANTGGNNVFDLWFGDVSLFRTSCTTPAARPNPDTGGSPRCPIARTGAATTPPPANWNGPFTRTVGAHDDAGEIVFDVQAANDACPELFSSDGGVYYNTDNGADCHNPNWEQPNVTPHALWLFAMAGANQAGDGTEDLYIGMQDTGFFASTNAGATWSNKDCCDVFDIVADGNRVVWDVCCGFTLFRANAGAAAGRATVATNPPGCCISFFFPDSIDIFGANQYVVVTGSGVFTTNNITVNPVVWTQLGAASTPAGSFCGVQAAVTGGTPTYYAQTTCIGGSGGAPETQGSAQLWSFTGAGPWQRIDNNDGITGGIGMFTVDPNNPNRLYASNLAAGGPQMIFSTDGGTNWTVDAELDTMMTAAGLVRYQTQQGPTSFSTFNGYEQPTLVAYDPENANIIVAGGRDSGVFLSTDAGANWSLLTDPFTPGTSGKAHLPHPFFAYFDHEPADTVNVYVGTRGRGIWRISVKLPVADAGGPYTTNEGTDVTLNGSGTDPDNQTLSFAWDLDNDGQFDDAFVANPSFTLVGQDGVFPVAVKVTDPDGAFDVDQATVTVNNVAPSVLLNSSSPQPENTAVTVTGTVSDPGWLDPLTATIDWGDGTAVGAIVGTVENIRPDATLTFSVSHVYGDDGTFTAKVCARDDDTETCKTIALLITNVNPTAEIDETGTVLINGVPVFIGNAGGPLTFKGRSTDPGSDDLLLSWDWDDGLPVPDVTTKYLNDPAFDPDPDPSPSIHPRDVTDTKSHAFDACLFDVRFLASDDDGGSAQDSVKVLVTGNSTVRFSAGYWQNVFRSRKSTPFTDAQIGCYLKIVGFVSLVFNETTDASTIAKAYDVLRVGTGTIATEQFDRQLLAALINFANGEPDWNELIDTNGDTVADTPFLSVIATAEAVRNNPASTKAQIVAQKDLLEKINLGTA